MKALLMMLAIFNRKWFLCFLARVIIVEKKRKIHLQFITTEIKYYLMYYCLIQASLEIVSLLSFSSEKGELRGLLWCFCKMGKLIKRLGNNFEMTKICKICSPILMMRVIWITKVKKVEFYIFSNPAPKKSYLNWIVWFN